jgi:hypothetical protein
MILAAAVAPTRASSVPSIRGVVAGLEFCEQATCGAAIFAGVFNGLVDGRFAFGSIAFAVNHEIPLPDPDDTKLVTGGRWTLKLLSGRTFAGIVTGGTLHNNGDGTFGVEAAMQMLVGGSGGLTFNGTLSHNTFPPTISGRITQ